MLTKIRDFIWNTFFLDFYLDPHWTIRFKIMNLISGDTLRTCLTDVHYNLEQSLMAGPGAYLYTKRAAYWTDKALAYYRK